MKSAIVSNQLALILLLQADQFKGSTDDAEEDAAGQGAATERPNALTMLARQLPGQQYESVADLVTGMLHPAQEHRPDLSHVQSFAGWILTNETSLQTSC